MKDGWISTNEGGGCGSFCGTYEQHDYDRYWWRVVVVVAVVVVLVVSSLWVSWRHGCHRSEGCDKTLVLDKI